MSWNFACLGIRSSYPTSPTLAFAEPSDGRRDGPRPGVFLQESVLANQDHLRNASKAKPETKHAGHSPKAAQLHLTASCERRAPARGKGRIQPWVLHLSWQGQQLPPLEFNRGMHGAGGTVDGGDRVEHCDCVGGKSLQVRWPSEGSVPRKVVDSQDLGHGRSFFRLVACLAFSSASAAMQMTLCAGGSAVTAADSSHPASQQHVSGGCSSRIHPEDLGVTRCCNCSSVLCASCRLLLL